MPDAVDTPDGEEVTQLYGLIGFPLTHSFSKQYFERKFHAENLHHCRFENFELDDVTELSAILLQYSPVLKGLAVTIPYKQQVLDYLDDRSSIPEAINACNCIQIRDGRLVGYNTDWIGFEKSFVPLLRPHHGKALVLGNGGAAVAVCYVLKKLGIVYSIVSRRLQDDTGFTYDTLTEQIVADHTIIINTTPLGTFPANSTFPSIPYTGITALHYLFDLVYNPDKTIFLQKGEERGAIIKNGADMLAIQAEENWSIWNS